MNINKNIFNKKINKCHLFNMEPCYHKKLCEFMVEFNKLILKYQKYFELETKHNYLNVAIDSGMCGSEERIYKDFKCCLIEVNEFNKKSGKMKLSV